MISATQKSTANRITLICLGGLILTGCRCGQPSAVDRTDTRPIKWAEAVEKPGVSNLHRITPTLYRGAQPSVEGFKSLKKMGIKTIVNFRKLHSDKDDIEAAGLSGAFNYVEIPANAWGMEDKTVIRFLSVVQDETNHPVFFHCQHGADRTGTMAAAYRVVIEGWSKEDAVDEMVNGGFEFHTVWRSLPKYIRGLDVEKLKAEIAKKTNPDSADAEKSVNLPSEK